MATTHCIGSSAGTAAGGRVLSSVVVGKSAMGVDLG